MNDDIIDRMRLLLDNPEVVARIEAILTHHELKVSVAEFFEQNKVQIALLPVVQEANAKLVALKEKHANATD